MTNVLDVLHSFRVFKQALHLLKHKETHYGERPFKCPDCGHSVQYQSDNCDRYEQTHNGDKHFQCSQCEKWFGLSSFLQQHLSAHSGKRPHQCKYCGKSFALGSHLKRHRRIHTGEKPYKCDQCEKCFGDSSHLKRHKAIHTGKKPLKCAECEKFFRTSGECNRHGLTHSSKKAHFQQLLTGTECDLTRKENQDVGHCSEPNVDAKHTQDFCSSEDCNNGKTDASEIPCAEQFLPCDLTSYKDQGTCRSHQSEPNADTTNAELGLCPLKCHSGHEQTDSTEKLCIEQLPSETEQELTKSEPEQDMCSQPKLNADTENIEQGSCSSKYNHNTFEQTDGSTVARETELVFMCEPNLDRENQGCR